jgi:hypothetical protein
MSGKILILGGGTFSHVRSHLALAAPAFGTTAKQIAHIAKDVFPDDLIVLTLTKMADSNSSIVTNEDVKAHLDVMLDDLSIKAIFFSIAMCDFQGSILDYTTNIFGLETENGKHASRLSSDDYYNMSLSPTEKVIRMIKERRPDIIVVGFKTTSGEIELEQYHKSVPLLTHCDYVLSNDVEKRRNFILNSPTDFTIPCYGDTARYSTLRRLVNKVHERLSE